MYTLQVSMQTSLLEERKKLVAFLESRSDLVVEPVDLESRLDYVWLVLLSEVGANELETQLRAAGFNADVFDADEHFSKNEESSHDYQTQLV